MSDTHDHFTVEDSGSTSDPADLTNGGTDRAGEVHGSAAGSSTTPGVAVAASAATARRDTAPVDTEPSDVERGDAGATGRAGASTGRPDLASLAGDDSIGHVFDQTNGVIEGIDGDSDGTAQSDELSSAERADEDPAFDAFSDSEGGAAARDDSRTTGS